MGLLRIATIAAIGVAVLPSDRDQQQRLYERAASTAEWVVTFCDRNGPTCAKGAEYWSAFLAKAEFGAKLAYDMARTKEGTGEETQRVFAPASLERDSGTLTARDRQPAWRGDGSRAKDARNKGSI